MKASFNFYLVYRDRSRIRAKYKRCTTFIRYNIHMKDKGYIR